MDDLVDAVVEEYSAPKPLHGAPEPKRLLKKERYEHRMMCYLKAEGKSAKEISLIMDVAEPTVHTVLKQPWAQAQILELIDKAGRSRVDTLLQGAGIGALQRLIVEMDNEASGTANSRITAADKILDRLFGKPNQPYSEHQEVDLDSLSDEDLAKIVTSGGGSSQTAPTSGRS